MPDVLAPVVRENMFNRRGAACGQRVTTYTIPSRIYCLKTGHDLRSMFVSASVAGRNSHGNSVLYRPQPVIRGKNHTPLREMRIRGRRCSRFAKHSQRGPRCTKLHLSSAKPGHMAGGSGWGARRAGGAVSGRTGCQQNCSPKRQASFVPFKESNTCRLNVFPETRTSEILCKPKPMEEQNPRLTTGSSMVFPWLIRGTRSALSSWQLTSGPKAFCCCKQFSCQAWLGIYQEGRQHHEGQHRDKTCRFQTCRIQNPDTPRAGGVGAAHGRAAGRGGAG